MNYILKQVWLEVVGGIVVGLVSFIFLATPALAAGTTTPPAVNSGPIATVNIQNARIVSQQGSTLNITFDITNRTGIQSGVDYAVELISDTSNGQVIADQKVFLANLTLNENSSIHEDITYTVPASLSGVYHVVLLSKNSSGFPYALADIGTITLTSQGGIAFLPGSCYLTVQGESGSPHYTLLQGVDIAPAETLLLTCQAINNSPSSIQATPQFETRQRTSFGDPVQATGGDASTLTFAANETKTFTIALPKPATPQAYNTTISLSSASGFSNSVVVHYVIRGASATVQTLSLDKDAYALGDTAQVSFIWSPSADTFQGSRASTGSAGATTYTVELVNGSNAQCAAPVTGTLASVMVHVAMPITMACSNPHATVMLKDANGNTLAQRDQSLSSPGHSLPIGPWWLRVLLGAILAILVLFILAKKDKLPLGKSALPLVLFGMLVVAAPLHMAKADTFCSAGYHDWEGVNTIEDDCYYQYTVNLDQSSYPPGATIQTTGTAQTDACDNEGGDPNRATLDGSTDYSGESYRLLDGNPGMVNEATYNSESGWTYGDPVYGSAQFVAPSSGGNYNIDFLGTGYALDRNFNSRAYTGSVQMPFSVNAPVNQPPIGYQDSLSCSTFSGWAFDPDSSSTPIPVAVNISNAGGGTTTTMFNPTIVRNDVNTGYGITGTHGYTFAMPVILQDHQPHLVDIVAQDTAGGPGNDLTNGGQVMTCSVTAATAQAQNCTLSGGTCSIPLTWNATNTNQNEVDILETAPDGTKVQIGGQSSAATLLVPVTQSGAYTLQVYNFGKSYRSSSLLATTNATAYAAPTLLCNSASSCTVGLGHSVTLSWACATPSDTSTTANFPTGGATSGSTSVTPSQTTTYALQCSPSESTTQLTVTTLSPSLQMSIIPKSVRSAGIATISWSSADVDSCAIAGPGVSLQGLSGTTTATISGQSTYTLTCQTGLGPISISRIVGLLPTIIEQ